MALAHSARGNRPEQTYPSHIGGVMEGVYRNALGFAPFISHERFAIYLRILLEGGEFHDLGKLDLDNQAVLDGRVSLPHLPVEHRDAGVHYLMTQLENRHAAALVHSHHRPGLPNLLEERASRDPFRFASVKEATDKKLAQYLELHKREMEGVRRRVLADAALPLPKRLDALEYRMLLSCLVDADYSDAGGEAEEPSCGNPRWKERLDSLNAYVQDLGAKAKHPDSVRNQLRQRFYLESLEAAISSFLEYCDAPVGSGKTTAILAHILKLAYHFNLRHIFVVVPFTNIITQTVRELKKALRLPDEENANLVVAEHHHNADFDSLELRHLSTTWRLPVIVTTAVQFFETLASNVPSKLRKLHQLPGSAVIIDESHAALPAPLMPLAWKWMDELTEHWGCRFCLCSGTSFRFWSLPAFTSIAAKEVTPLLSEDLTNQLSDHERERVNLRAYDGEASHFSGAGALVNHIETFRGPRLVVMNTVQSAAVLASIMRNEGHDVLHLSGALTPEHQEKVLDQVTRRLEENSPQRENWTLLATSCVECGLNLSFRNGLCELRSLSSYLQLAGRVSRNHEYSDSNLVCFTVTEERFSRNPAFEVSRKVFQSQIEGGKLRVQSITEAITESYECEMKEGTEERKDLCKLEHNRAFVDVANQFKIIDDERITAVADETLMEKLKRGEKVTPRELQRGSVRLPLSVAERLGLLGEELPFLPPGQYDDFLGYMAGLV